MVSYSLFYSNVLALSHTYMPSCSHPEQFFRLHGNTAMEIRRIHWFDLDGNLSCQDFIQALLGIISHIWITVKIRQKC